MMDPNKKQALIKWLNALSQHRIQSFNDLRDGSVIVSILKSAGNHIISNEVEVDTIHKRYAALKSYVEAFYHQSFDDPGLLDFTVLESTHVRAHVYDMEMGKLLLAIIGCVVQDPKCKEMFVRPALSMDESSQLELKEMIETVCFNNQMEMGLPADFHEVLKRHTDTSTALEAAHFLQLLADGLASPQRPPQACTPLVSAQPTGSGPSTPRFAMYTNSPQGAANNSGINIRDISSPLRVMSLSSPMTPLNALMNSPQLAQKMMQREADNRKEAEALLRQKAHEYKKLEVALHNEQHLCSELSLDLQEKSRELQDKDQRVRELERQLGEVRKMRDQLDELEVLRIENDKLQKDVARLTSRLTEHQDLREHSQVLERENRESLRELSKAREEMKLLESLKTSNDELHVKCHKQQLDMAELEASLQHCRGEVEQLHGSLEEARNMYNVAQHTCNSLKAEKEELEEMVAVRTGSLGVSMDGNSFVGETMSIVTEKRMSELQSEFDKMKATWIDPSVHESVLKQLALATEAKQTVEERFLACKKQLIGAEDEISKLTNSVRQFETRVSDLDCRLLAEQEISRGLEVQVSEARDQAEDTARSLSEMQALRDQSEVRVHNLERELSQTRTELDLANKEVEAQKEASEGRRLTILQLDKEKEEKSLMKNRLSLEVDSWKFKVSHLTQELDNWKSKTADTQRKEVEVTEQLYTLQSEQIEKDNVIRSYQEKLKTLEEDVAELTNKLKDEKELNLAKIQELEEQLKSERVDGEKRKQAYKSLSTDFEELKSSASLTEERLSAEARQMGKEKKAIELELHKLKCDYQAATQTYDCKQQKTELKYKDTEAALKGQIEKLKEVNEESVQIQKGLKEELEAASCSIQKRKAEIEKLNKALEAQNGKIFELEESQGGYEKATVELSIQLKQKEEMLESLQGHLESTRASYTEEIAQLQAQIREVERTIVERDNLLTSTKAAYIAELEESKAKCECQIAELKQQHQDMLTALEKDKSELQSEMDKLKAVHKETVDTLENKLSEKETVRLELECDVKEKETRIDTLMKQLKYLEDNEKSLNNALTTSLTDYDTMKNLIKQKEDLAASKDKEISEKEIQIKKLAQVVESSKMEKEQLLASFAETEEAHKLECSNYEKSLAELNHNLEALKAAAQKEKESLQAEMSQLQSMIDSYRSGAEELKQQCSEIASSRDSSVSDLRAEISSLTQQLSELEHSLDTYKSSNSGLEAQLNNLEQVRNSISAEFEKYKEAAEVERQEFQDRVKHLDETQADLGQQLLDVKAEAAKVKDEMENQLIKLRREKEEGERQADCKLHEKEVETEGYWRSQLEQLQEEYEKEFSESKKRIEELADEHKNQIEEMAEEKDMFYATQIQAYQERVIGLEKVVAEKREEIAAISEELTSKQKEINKNMTDYSTTVEKLNAELIAKQEEINKNMAEHSTAVEKLNAELTVKQEEMNKNIIENSVIVDKLKAELTAKQEEMNKNLAENSVTAEKLNAELQNMKETIEKERQEAERKLEMTIGEYETELDSLRVGLSGEKEEIVAKLSEEHHALKARMENELEEKRVAYQQMMGDMQERLGDEVQQLRERLSQMKCQYETMLENEKKDNKQRQVEFDAEIKSARSEADTLKQKIEQEAEIRAQLELQLAELRAQIAELQESLRRSQVELESQTSALTSRLEGVESELRGSQDEVKRERSEKEEKEKQLEYSQERTDTLTAELSSQQQQLAAVEEEKRVLEEEMSSFRQKEQTTLMAAQETADRDLRLVQMEKMEIERQLQANMKCYEAVQKTNTELERLHERMTQERANLETRNRELEQSLFNQREREKKIVDNNEHQIQKAAELNETLRRQLEEKCREVHEVNSQFNKKMEAANDQISKLKAKYETELKSLREEKISFEIEASTLKTVQDKLASTEAERAKLQDINEKYNIHYNKKKETISQLTEQLKASQQEVENLKKVEEKLHKGSAPLREELSSEQMKSKALGLKVRNLETQLDLADRKIREYQKSLEKGSSVFLGDSSEFHKMISIRENATDASFMENHPSSVPMDDSIFDYEKEGRPSTMSTLSLTDDTLTPGTRASRTRRRLSKSVSSTTVASSNDYNADTMSIGSTTSLMTRLRSRDSAISLNKSILSTETGRSTASSVPRGTGGVFHCEDEPIEFEWGRLGELQRRNTLCPAHLKTSYPVETQTVKASKFREDALRESTMGNLTLQTLDGHVGGSGKKRKPDSSFDSDSADSKSKQAKTAGCVYQKPGPPTPANSRRSSKGSRSPGGRRYSGKGSRSPRTPLGGRARGTPKRGTPKHTRKLASTVDRENPGSGKKQTRRESVAFNIDSGPLSMGQSTRLTRQKGFIQKQPPSSSQVSSLIGLFENRSTPQAEQGVVSMSSRVSPFPRVALSFTSHTPSLTRPRFTTSTPTFGLKSMMNETVSSINDTKPAEISAPASDLYLGSSLQSSSESLQSLKTKATQLSGEQNDKKLVSTVSETKIKSNKQESSHLPVPTNLKPYKSDTDIEKVVSKPPIEPQMGRRGLVVSKATSTTALSLDPGMELVDTPDIKLVVSAPPSDQIKSAKRSLPFSDIETPIKSANVPGQSGRIKRLKSSTPESSRIGPDFSIVRKPHIYDEPSNVYSSSTSREQNVYDEPVYEEIGPAVFRSDSIKPDLPASRPCMSPSITHQTSLFSDVKHVTNSPHIVRHLGDSPDFARSFRSLRIKGTPTSPHRSLISRIRSSKKSSSTSRFRGTPIKLRTSLSVPSPHIVARSCSALNETPADSQPLIRHLTPHKVKPELQTPKLILDDSLKKSLGTLKPIKDRTGAGNTPVKFVGSLISKLTPRARPSKRIAPEQTLF